MSGHACRTPVRIPSRAQVFPAQVKRITAVTHTFPVDRYAWKFIFYVVEDLIHPVILGADFLQRTWLLIDLYQGFAFFRFDPENKLPLIGRTPELVPLVHVRPWKSLLTFPICLNLHLTLF
jgi:hypothetical protein